jgi:hypothetical protein
METIMTYHAIEMDFYNELAQKIIVITCPVERTTFAIVNDDKCRCGKAI